MIINILCCRHIEGILIWKNSYLNFGILIGVELQIALKQEMVTNICRRIEFVERRVNQWEKIWEYLCH